MDDIISDRLLRQHGVEPLGPCINHKDIYGTTSANDFDRDLHGGNQHYSPFLTPPRFSPKNFHPMDDKIRQDELERIAYLEKQEKQVAQKINEILARSQEFLNKTPRTPNGWFSKVCKMWMEAQAREMA